MPEKSDEAADGAKTLYGLTERQAPGNAWIGARQELKRLPSHSPRTRPEPHARHWAAAPVAWALHQRWIFGLRVGRGLDLSVSRQPLEVRRFVEFYT